MAETVPLRPGLWGVLATPFRGVDRELDPESLRREVRLFRELPATGLVALGVFGEAAALDAVEQHRVVTTVREERGDLPIVVGLSARSTARAVEQGLGATAAAGDALAGLMVQVNSADPAALAGHLTAVHSATGAGIVVQDYPIVSGVHIASAQLIEAVAQCPFVVAIKSEAPPTCPAVAELTAATTVPVFGGLGGAGLLDELAAGAAGAMTGFSHPEGLLEALRAWDEGGLSAAGAAFQRWLPLVNFEAQARVGLAIRKESLRRRGVFADAAVRPPAATLPDALRPILRAHLDALKETAL
jgi:4-hydroxy-tetrahydrodipicolinate synthase